MSDEATAADNGEAEPEVSLPKEQLMVALEDYYRGVGRHDGSSAWHDRIERIADFYCGKVRELAQALHDQVGAPFRYEHLLGRSADQPTSASVDANSAASALRRHPLCPPS